MFKTRKTILLFVFVSISSIVFSQEKAIHFGASFNAKITHQIFEDSRFGESNDAFSITASGNVYFDLNSKFQLITGLSYSQYQINQIDYSPILACDLTSTFSVDPFNSYFKENYNTGYLGIPLEVRWKIVGEANHLFLQFGFEGLIKVALNESLSLVECNGANEVVAEDNFLKELNNFLLLSKLGIGYEFQLSKKMKLFFEPNVEYSLTKFFKKGSGNSNFFNIGLNTGIKF